MKSISCVCAFGFIGMVAAVAGGAPVVPRVEAGGEAGGVAGYGGSLMEREKLLGSMWGRRDWMAAHGVTVERTGVYTLQGVVSGGSATGHDWGNLYTGNVVTSVDTEKADLWSGGFLTMRMQVRQGEAVTRRAGTVSPVTNAALLPLNEGELGDNAWAMPELTFTQFLHPKFAVMGGLINTAGGDANPISGSLQSTSHFMNTGFVMSPVIVGQLPQSALGGGVIWKPTEKVTASLMAMGTEETAGTNPFTHYEGTTIFGEVDWEYEIGGKPGGMGLSGAYSVGQERLGITSDPRVVLEEFQETGEALTKEDAWSVFWNGFQYGSGNQERGWGVFARVGFSDAEPSPVSLHGSVGIGGTGLIPGRTRDRWGVGVYHQELSGHGLLGQLGLGNENGGEVFYSVSFTKWMRLTLDAQYIDSALPKVGHAMVVGTRLAVDF